MHSSLKKIGVAEDGSATVINALLETLGSEGTLAMPAFSIRGSMYETVLRTDEVFDPQASPITVGKIPSVFGQWKNAQRSIHFTHSIVAVGKLAKEITHGHYEQVTVFGSGTPFDRLLNANVKIVGLGVGVHPVTFYHTFEDFNPELFPGVYHPHKFSVKLKVDSEIVIREQFAHNAGFYNRRIDKNPEIESCIRKHMLQSGKMRTGTVGDASSWWMYGRDFMDELMNLYKNGKTIYKV